MTEDIFSNEHARCLWRRAFFVALGVGLVTGLPLAAYFAVPQGLPDGITFLLAVVPALGFGWLAARMIVKAAHRQKPLSGRDDVDDTARHDDDFTNGHA